ICLCGACALGLVTPALGRLRDPPWGHYDPCARSSLHGDAPTCASQEARTGAEKCRSRASRGAPACVMGRSSPATRRWARPRGGSRGAALPHQRLSALCSPSFFLGEPKTDEGHPEPHLETG